MGELDVVGAEDVLETHRKTRLALLGWVHTLTVWLTEGMVASRRNCHPLQTASK